MAAVALIGGAGFIGCAAARRLALSGHRVVCCDSADRLRRAAKHIPPQVEQRPIYHDLPPFPPDVETIILLQWTSSPATSMKSIRDDAMKNIGRTLELLESIQSFPSIKRVVFISSGGAVYGEHQGGAARETDAAFPISAYGAAKLAVEQYVHVYGLKFGYSPIILRLGNPYGPYQFSGTPVGIIAHFLRNIYSKKSLDVFGDGDTIRDYLYISDVADAIASTISPDASGGTYNVGSGVGISIRDLIDLIRISTRRSFDVSYHPPRSFDVRAITLNSEKFSKEFAWTPLVSLREGIHSMWRSLQLEVT